MLERYCHFVDVYMYMNQDTEIFKRRLSKGCLNINWIISYIEIFLIFQQNTPCFYETQPGGCTKPNCKFRHNFPKHTAVPPMSATTVPPVTTLQASQPGNKVVQPPPGTVFTLIVNLCHSYLVIGELIVKCFIPISFQGIIGCISVVSLITIGLQIQYSYVLS